MKRGLKLSLLLALAGMFAAPAFAAAKDRTPGVDRRERRQNRRIRQGVKSGELTKDETKQLRQGEKNIRQMERQAKSDGTVTQEERKELHKALNEESKEIYQEKHDADKRPNAR